MTDEEHEQANQVYLSLYDEIKKLVDEKTKNLSPNQDDFVRMKLTEDYRFWN